MVAQRATSFILSLRLPDSYDIVTLISNFNADDLSHDEIKAIRFRSSIRILL